VLSGAVVLDRRRLGSALEVVLRGRRLREQAADRGELLGPRRKAFAKLDVNGNGVLSFEEWAVRTVDKFAGADGDKSGWLTPAEYATTAPPPGCRPAV